MKQVVAYCRVSTKAQAGEDKFGLEAQQVIINDYCAAHDMEIVKWYIDKGESGVKESRVAFDQILYGDEIKNPPYEAVVVAKSDRIARDIKLYFYFMMLLEKKSVKLISATEEVVNDETGLGAVYQALMLFVAQQERENIMRRTSAGRQRKSARGGYSGGRCPVGYKVIDGRLVENPEESRAVKLMYQMKREGATFQAIQDELNSRGWLTKKGKPYGLMTIRSVLTNNERIYRGEHYDKATDTWLPGEQDKIDID